MARKKPKGKLLLFRADYKTLRQHKAPFSPPQVWFLDDLSFTPDPAVEEAFKQLWTAKLNRILNREKGPAQ